MPTREYKERLVSGTAIVESIAPKKDAVIDKPRTFRRLCAFRVFIVLQKPVHFRRLPLAQYYQVLCNAPMLCGAVRAACRVRAPSGDAITCECGQ